MMRKLPMLTSDNEAFWQGGEKNVLNIHFCKSCSGYFHPPSPVCPACRSLDVAPKPVSGRGRVYSFTINYQKWVPDLKTPYVVAIVELEEQAGLRFVSNIVGCEPDSVSIGMEVQVVFEKQDDVWLPLFERAA